MATCSATEDFFYRRIGYTIDPRHPLAILASRMPWQVIEVLLAQITEGFYLIGAFEDDVIPRNATNWLLSPSDRRIRFALFDTT